MVLNVPFKTENILLPFTNPLIYSVYLEVAIESN
jgi:hypothetical protein